MAVFKTIQFLPEVFRTDSNKKFLNATVDQLVSEPRLKKINGYIGRKLSPAYKSTDSYIGEPSTDRQNYQLEPSLIIKNEVTNVIDFATTYTDIVNQIRYHGGLTDKHDRLFDNEYYTFNPKIDLDKFINFSQYYWLENGPNAVTISSSGVPLAYTYVVTYDTVTKTYKFTDKQGIENPSITLARGGVYQFVVNDVGNPFWIQTKVGVTGTDLALPNYSTREVLGVSNNGTDNGIVIFTVPTYSAQEEWTSMPVVGSADYATDLSYVDLYGANPDDVNLILGGIDGIVTSIDGKTIIFKNQSTIDDAFWVQPDTNVVGDIVTINHSTTSIVPYTQRNDIYTIRVYKDASNVDRIVLIPTLTVNDENKVKIRAGIQNVGKEFYSRYGIYYKVPLITASLNSLYYQNANDSNAVGFIKIIDPAAAIIDPVTEIVGKQTYTSPNGVQFSNGLKVTFDSSALSPFTNNTYYVEGVGDSIKLIPISDLISPELDNNMSTQDYFTINRGSLDQNAWSRSNRWFHGSIIQKSADYNGTTAIFDQVLRASRPILEFNADLQLYKYGTVAKSPIDILDVVVTDAYTQIQGVICASQDSHTFTIDNTQVTLVSGTRVVFTNDANNDVRNKIYNFSIEKVINAPSLTYRAYIEETTDTIVFAGHTVVVNMNTNLQSINGTIDGENNAKQWYYNGTDWVLCQQKTNVNQHPLFDVIDSNGVSFSDLSTYLDSSFTGTKIFSYKEGTGISDTVLGIPLSYRNFVTQGDIQFDNNFDIDEFSYLTTGGVTETLKVNSGLLQKNIGLATCVRENIWTITQDFSKQFQIYSYVYDGVTNLFPIDELPDISVATPNIKVIINNLPISADNFATTTVVDRLAVLVNPTLLTKNDVVFIKIYNSNIASTNAFYEVPINLDTNSLNTNLETLTLGQMRNHLISLKEGNMEIIGSVPGSSNLRDISYFKNGGSILQHSAPLVYAGTFLTHPVMNFVDSIKYANNEYIKFKTKFLELSTNPDFDQNDISGTVDAILGIINNIKNSTFPWVYSDMVPYSSMTPRSLPTYTVINPEIRSYEITNIFQDKILSNKAVFVYLTRTISGTTTKTLLVKDTDFYFNQDRPAITFNSSFALLYADLIDIVEYDDTTGSYVPETPTKLGLYPKFVPTIYTDDTYRVPIQVIQGHDGSIMPAFLDFRDQLLLELERRIYNNIKVEYDVNLFNINDYMPGKFRVTDYTRQEFNQILSQGFLSWVGTNRVDYGTTDTFKSSDPFTWNYKRFRDTINGESLPGSWRAVFRYFYDTDRPHTHPWEMLGFSEKPSYWDDRYGPAPYTGGNSVLWSDLSLGYIHSGSRAGFDSRYQRPNLAQIIPVDENGNLRNPTEVLVTDFDSSKADIKFAVGDIGPAELAWRRSSEYPFMLQLALALAKPAKYFSLLSNVRNYVRNPVTAQFSINNTNQHITPQSIKINGYDNNGIIEYSAGYLNYIRDYVKSIGISDAEKIIKDNLTKLTVQLSYKMAGYTDKKYISLLAEQSSPSSINDSIVIPSENYRLELYKSAPINKISYSAVVVEKTDAGWSVSGYDLTNPYFFIIPSLPNNNAYTITSGSQRGVIYRDYQHAKVTIPYGFEFNTVQQVVDFLVSYQRFLISQGFIFTDVEASLKEEKNWILSAKEFLYWHEQGWNTGSILVLSPVSTTLNVYDSTAIVDEITNSPYGSKVVDINFSIIKKNDFTVFRENNLFTFRVNNGQTIAFAELRLVQYEHLLVLDNQTDFKDIIYLPELGNRQYRLKILGSKTDLWSGSLELPGFMYSSSNIPEWNAGTDYLKGTIVKNKSVYYTALQDITAAEKFQTNYWKVLPSSELKYGLINNFATNAGQSLSFYDIDNQPINTDMQVFSDGIIGFRNRDYFNNLGIDSTTQSKFYQGMIKQKGTINSVAALEGAIFNNINTNINVYENWAVRVGEYGAIDSNQMIEVRLDEKKISSSPTAIQFVDSTITAEPNIVSYEFGDLYKITGDWNPNLFRTQTLDQSDSLQPLPVAGFVNNNDIDATIFNIEDYSTLTTIVNFVGTGYKIWVARDWDKTWNVYRANIIQGTTFAMTYDIDDSVKVTHSTNHGLVTGDLVVIKNFSSAFSGVYRVKSISDSTSFYITLYQNLDTLVAAKTIVGNGILYKLVSAKIDNPSLVTSIEPNVGWVENDKIWVENLDTNKNWGVYNKTNPWDYNEKVQLSESQYSGNDNFGKSVSITPNRQVLYGGAPGSGSGRISIFAKNSVDKWTPNGFLWGNSNNLSNFGQVLVSSDDFLITSAPTSSSNTGCVYVFYNQVLVQILTASTPTTEDFYGKSLAVSKDGRFLYVGAPGSNTVFCYASSTRSESSQTIYGDGTTNSFTLTNPTDYAVDLVITKPLSSSELIPNVDYSISQFTNGVSVISGVYDATTTYYDISGSLSVNPGASSITHAGMVPTGGTGSGAIINVVRPAGLYTYQVKIISSGHGYTAGDTLKVKGSLIGGVDTTNDLTITVTNLKDGTNVLLVNTPIDNDRISIIKRTNYYKLIDTLPKSSESVGTDGFGSSVVCSDDGAVIAVGAPNETIDGYTNAGGVYVYHRTISDFTTDGIRGTFIAPDNFNSIRRITLDGEVLIEGLDYFIVQNAVQFNPSPLASKKLIAETNQFVFDQKITGELGNNFQFGGSLAMCGTGCNIISASVGYTNSAYNSGAVTRYMNVGRIYGTITGSITNPIVTAGDIIIINNYPVTFSSSTLNSVIIDINAANIPGITAENYKNKLKINSTVVEIGSKLDVKKGKGTAISDLGLVEYIIAQTLIHPERSGEKFGTALAVNDVSSVLAVASDGADLQLPSTFDNQKTTYDSNSTYIVDLIKDSGAVYMYDLMNNPYSTQDNPSLYAYTQKLIGPNIKTGYGVGSSIAISGSLLATGVTNDYNITTGGGSVYTYTNPEQISGWNLIRYKEPRVDIGAVNTAFIYNSVSKLLIDYFDYLDPAKGKILGIVEQYLDYKETFDPASYSFSLRSGNTQNPSFFWADKYVGKTWWDLSIASFIDYEQDTLTYRAKNWGALFPGSQIKIYEWVKSSVPPSQYVKSGGNGIPKYADDSSYSSVTKIDSSTGIISQDYYFWVGNKTSVDPVVSNRDKSVYELQTYISDPRDQGIPYLGLLSPNSVALYNVNDKLSGTDVVLDLNIAKSRSKNLLHNEYELIQEGNPTQIIPSKIITKLKDSLAGFDSSGSLVPDYQLSEQDKIGVSFRPRQSIFINRLAALQNYVDLVNVFLKENPILLITEPSLLYLKEPQPTTGFDAILNSEAELAYLDASTFSNGYTILIPNDSNHKNKWTLWQFDSITQSFVLTKIQAYNTPLYWSPEDWYSSDFKLGTKLTHIVNTYGNIQTLTLLAGQYIKVLDNGAGQWLIYYVNDSGSLELKAAQNATLQINTSVYNTTLGSGFDTVVFDLVDYDPQVGKELVNIFDSVYQEILIKDLANQFNQLFFNLVNYIFSEQKAPDWIFKTSFIDVYHQIRTLEQIPTYVKDNQTFYRDYINEIKPYRTILKDYVPSYNALDIGTGDWTDFDLPSRYDFTTGTYKSLNVASASDQELLYTSPYNNWKDHYKYKITSYVIGNPGTGYTVAPNVEIYGGGGGGASAITTVNLSTGEITGVTVITPGEGFTTTPNVVINGTGTGAIVYPVLTNEYYSPTPSNSYNTVRNISTSLTFDRVDYFSANVVTWDSVVGSYLIPTVITSGVGSGNIWVSSGNIYVYNNETFILNSATTAESLFDYTKFTKLNSGNVLLRSVDRISSYYVPNVGMPGADLTQLMDGVDYGGTKVKGAKFTACNFSHTSNVTSFNYTGLTINSGNVDLTDFQQLGFEIDQPVRIQALVPFDFANNGYFKIVNVSHDYMTLTGEPIQTTYNLIVDTPITVNVGDVITQNNNLANAYVLQSRVNSVTIPIIHVNTGFTFTGNTVKINGLSTISKALGIETGGNVDVKIDYLELDTTVLDSNIYSTFLDTALGTRPEDINIVGGAYVDVYNSHAPEELIPGRMYDSLEMRVFSNTVGNTATYGFRVFQPMSSNIQYNRISANATTTLSSSLGITDSVIHLTDASMLPDANPQNNIPGIVFINGEKIHYYQRYDTDKLSMAFDWQANTSFVTGALMNVNGNCYLIKGNVYANASTYINSANIQQVYNNSLAQIRRSVDGTGANTIHAAGTIVSDGSLQQAIPDGGLYFATFTGNAVATANVTWKLTLSSNITANIGDYITQFVNNTGNVRVLGSVTNGNVVAVDIIGGNVKLAANIGTRVNIANPTSYTTTTANIVSMSPLGTVRANGNVVLSGVTVLRSNAWVQLNDGTGLEGSTTASATFIKAEPSYIP
ncbi:hypothetical protein UFOVP257_437 [uncultured Caudovirales phage]|uniref:YHYH domain-containing protein n=1 Tax=uncultured Caudovirales phage TaxID=2100421 RepID=A0A6J5LHN7_9CAUD|nr:hypothetical protein UFOVP257_437 [uncultured Caudovirales phage]